MPRKFFPKAGDRKKEKEFYRKPEYAYILCQKQGEVDDINIVDEENIPSIVKIGKTTVDQLELVRQYGTRHWPHGYHVLWYSNEASEWSLHRRFKNYRIYPNREWFYLRGDLLLFLRRPFEI